VREHIWEIAQSMSIINKRRTLPEQCDLLRDCCVTRSSALASPSVLWEQYMAVKTNLNSENSNAAQNEGVDGGLRRMKNRLEYSQTKQKKVRYLSIYYIAPMLLLL